MSVDSDKAPSVAQWPDASLLPDEDDPPIVWARFYRDVMGWVVLPMPGPMDTSSMATSLARTAVADWIDSHGGEPDDETRDALWELAHDEASRARRGPIGYIAKAAADKVHTASDVTDEMLRLWWEPLEHSRGPRCEADHRPICILPNRSAKGLPVCVVDVDVDEGGDAAGPWGAGLPGPKTSTPHGGMHTFCLASGRELSSEKALAEGVDVIASGRTGIPVPSGSATPRRRWTAWEPMHPAPEALRRPVKHRHRPKQQATAPGLNREPGDEDGAGEHEPGRAAVVLAAETGDGERNYAAAVIVGVLARPRGCPDDFARTCLDLLAEEMAGRDQPSAVVVEEAQRWHHLLTRGPRDAEFAAEVLAAWIRVRDVSVRPWSESKARIVARSMWRTCDRREEGQAGAEDAGYGPATDDVPTDIAGAVVDLLAVAAALQAAPEPPPPPPPAQPPVIDPPSAGHYVLDGPTEAERAAALAATRDAIAGIADGAPVGPPRLVGAPPRVDPFRLFRSLRRSYPREAFEEDCRRQPIDLTRLGWFMDFNRGIPEGMSPPPATGEQARLGQTDPSAMGLFGHGIGTWLAEAVGGLVPGDFKAFGAAGAKAGKTYFVGQFVEGLAFCSACRLMGLKGYESAPIVMARWITEMPKDGELNLRFMARHLGFDAKTITQGVMAERMVAQAAERDRFAPAEYVARARHFYETYEDARYPSGAVLDLIEEIDLSALPPARGQGRMREDPRGGPSLVGHVADAVQAHRRRFAEMFGVPESDVVPLVVWDPAQRFAGDDSADARSAIDALFRAVLERICKRSGGVHGIALCTSDTTKTAAKELTLQDFQTREGRAVAADVFAGAQSIMHIADTVVALMAEPPTARSLTTTMWARVLQGRTGAPPESFPFLWEMHCGRFRAQAPGKPRESAPRLNDIPDFGRA